MRIRRALVFFCFVAASGQAYAQQHEGQSLWLNVDYTYSDVTYTEPSMTEKSRLAGIRGDVGIGLFDNFAISAGGQYQDGNFNYDGATFTGSQIKQVTKDYLRETYVLANFLYGPVTFSGGVGQREWFNDVTGSYRRREIYNYYPIAVTVMREGLYFKIEDIVWKSGKNKSYMHDVSAAENDVEFSQGSGSMYGAEIGYLIPTPDHFATRIYVSYRRWDTPESDTQNDNVHSLQVPKNNTVTLQVGLGVAF